MSVSAERKAKRRAEILAPVTRWSHARKHELLMALAGGLVTEAEACAAHNLSPDELAAWRAALRRGGADALKQKAVRT